MKQMITALAFAFLLGATAQAQLQIHFDQTTVELGTLLWHSPRTATFKITNKGARELRIIDVHPDCGCTAVEWTREPIAPGGTGTVRATYDAELLGHFNKELAVYTNLAAEPQYLTIMGQVSTTQTEVSSEFPYKIGDYYLSTDDIEFDDVNRGDQPVYVLQVFNAGKKSYTPSLMHLPKYLSATSDPAVIRPGRMGRILVKLDSDELPMMGLTQTNVYLSRFMGDRVSKETEINVSATLLPDLKEYAAVGDYAPHAALDSLHITISPTGKKKKATGELTLKNEGNAPLVVSALQVYNPGISVSLSKREIKPGTAQKIKISAAVGNTYFKGRRRILLITNDPHQPKMVIDVTIKE